MSRCSVLRNKIIFGHAKLNIIKLKTNTHIIMELNSSNLIITSCMSIAVIIITSV